MKLSKMFQINRRGVAEKVMIKITFDKKNLQTRVNKVHQPAHTIFRSYHVYNRFKFIQS